MRGAMARRNVRRTTAIAVAGLAITGLSVLLHGSPGPVGTAEAQLTCAGDLPGSAPAPVESDDRLLFGIFPGGPAGVIAGPRPPAVPEDQAKIDAALDELRGERRFVVHQYAEYVTPAEVDQRLSDAEAATAHYAARGMRVEWVLRYRPASAPDVDGYVAFVREAVRRLGSRPAVTAIQVTNEANLTFAPDAADGAYAGASDALVQGVIAAKDEASSLGLTDLGIGFNWFYRTDPASEQSFWSGLGAKGGAALAESVDWVGLDAYPETFFPPGNTSRRSSMVNAMSVLRECLMPLAGLGESVPIHVTENGWPTAPNRSYAEQERALREMILAVYDFRAVYNVTDYRWFTLRDSNSADPNFQQQYGLMRDDYTPKPAFGAFRELIALLGVGAPGLPGGDCAVRIRGSAKRDVLIGSAAGDKIGGAGGPDRIRGLEGNDCLSGGPGRDRVGGNAGADRVGGGGGHDRLAGGHGDDELVSRAGGRDVVRCGPGRDVARVDRRDAVRGCERVRV